MSIADGSTTRDRLPEPSKNKTPCAVYYRCCKLTTQKSFNQLPGQLQQNVIIGPRRLALIGAIAAVALAIIFYPLIVLTPNVDLNQVTVKLSKVDVVSANETDQRVTVKPTFAITNTNDVTLTTSNIDFEL